MKTPQVRVNKNTYTKTQLGSLALRAICSECIHTNTPLTRVEIDLGVDDVVQSVQRINKRYGNTLSKSDIRSRIFLLAESWVG